MPINDQNNHDDNVPENPMGKSSNDPGTSKTKPASPGHNQRRRSAAHADSNQMKSTVGETASIPKIDETEVIESNRISREANEIAKKSNWVNFSLLVVTMLLAGAAFYQYSVSKNAAEIAKLTLDSANAFNSRMFKMQQDAKKSATLQAENKEKLDSQTFNLQKQGLDAQIKSLKETQKEFEVENKPLVQVINFQFDTLMHSKKILISFAFRNYGKQPVKCLTSKYAVDFQTGIEYKEKQKINWNNVIQNAYLTNSTASFCTWKTGDTINQASVNAIYNGTISTYVFGSMIYQNTVTSKKWMFNFRLRYTDHQFGTDGLIDTAIVVK